MNTLGCLISLWILFSICLAGDSRPCILRDLGNNRRVCVCNTTYCDTIKREPKINKNQYVIISSTQAGERFNKEIGTFIQQEETNETESNSVYSFLSGSSTQETTVFTVNTSARYQTIHGFGGAFTDSTGFNMLRLPKELQESLLRSYFSDEGIEYSLCRLPIGGTDFSKRPYAYDDGSPDPDLKNFKLQKEDFKYKIPFILKALKMSKKNIKFVAAAWSPSPWMKMNNNYTGGFLKPQYYDVYAKYLLKFLDEYKKHNISVWAISTGNEPTNVFFPTVPFNVLGWTPSTLTSWIVHNFGPALRCSPHNQTKILTYDDQRWLLHWWVKKMFESDKRVFDLIDGIAVHWYWDFIVPASVVEKVHNDYPSKFLLYTEACNGYQPWEKEKVILGSWKRAEAYVENIIENLNNWVTGWIDWNLCLDKQGGPNWVKNFVDSPIIVDPASEEFLKQPMFYALGHFSKFVDEGAVRIGITPAGYSDVRAVAFRNPNGRIVFVFINKSNSNKNLSIKVPNKGLINIEVPPRTFSSILFNEC